LGRRLIRCRNLDFDEHWLRQIRAGIQHTP
jgi:hypothetical protein